jgi:hypothetical protein
MLNLSSAPASLSYRSAGVTSASDQASTADGLPRAETAAAAAKNDLSISLDALAASADSRDNAKDFSALAQEMRSTLDEQQAMAYANGKTSGTPSLTTVSGRGVAAVALNASSLFSPAEVKAAGTELRERENMRFSQTAFSAENWTAGVSAYSQDVVNRYDGMSSEERAAKDWTDQTRSKAASFVEQASQSEA